VNTLGLAWRNLLRNRRRSLMTLIAMVLGLTAVLLCGGYIRLCGGNIRARLCDFLRTAPSQKARDHLLLRCHGRLALRHRILKALQYQLCNELAGMNGTTFIHEQLFNPLTAVEGKLYLPYVYVAVEHDGVAGSTLARHPSATEDARTHK